MASKLKEAEIKRASLSELFQPGLLADQPEPLSLSSNSELLNLEARLRTVTSLEIYWSILRPTNKTGEKDLFDLNPDLHYEVDDETRNTALNGAFLAACSSKGSTSAANNAALSTASTLKEQRAPKMPNRASTTTIPPNKDIVDRKSFSSTSNHITASPSATATTSGRPLANMTTEQVRNFLTRDPVAKAVFNARLEKATSKIEANLRAQIQQSKAESSSSIRPVLNKEGVEQFLNSNPFAKQLFDDRVKMGVSLAESSKAGQILLELSQAGNNSNQCAAQPYTILGTEALAQLLKTNGFAKAAFEEQVRMKVEQDKMLIRAEIETKLEEQLQKKFLQKYDKDMKLLKTDFEATKKKLEQERHNWMTREEAEMIKVNIRRRGITLNDSDTLKLISQTPKVSHVYRDLCVEALRLYKKDLKAQYQQKLDEVEAECWERGGALHNPRDFDAELPRVEADVVKMLEIRLSNEKNMESPWIKKIQELLNDHQKTDLHKDESAGVAAASGRRISDILRDNGSTGKRKRDESEDVSPPRRPLFGL